MSVTIVIFAVAGTPRAASFGPGAPPDGPDDPAAPPAGRRRGRVGEHVALAVVLAVAAVGYLWRLDRNGYANGFYAAAVRSMTDSWHNFFFGAFDPGGFITVDKPPLAFWIQAASAKIFGFSSWSLLVPQAAAGVAAVYVLYRIVRAQAGPLAGLVAALALTVTPITVAVNRDNNPDATLVLLLLLAAWAVQAAIRTGSFRRLALGGLFIGLAFTTKMLAAYLVVPGLALAFALAAAVGWRRRLGCLLGGGAVMVAASAAWLVTVDLIPKADRPYVGGSTNDTVSNLVFGYNGLGRVNGNEGDNRGGIGRAFGGQTGFGRMFDATVGGQVAWLIPCAVLSLVVGLVATARRPRPDLERGGLVMWGGWAIACWGVFSFSKGIFHSYYTAELAPALAALTGIGAATLVGFARQRSRWAGLLAVGVAASAALEVVLLRRTPSWNAWLRPTVVGFAIVVVLGLAVLLALRSGRPRAVRGTVVAVGLTALVAVFAGPAAYAVTPIQRAVGGSDPQAGPPTAAGRNGFAAARRTQPAGRTAGRAPGRGGAAQGLAFGGGAGNGAGGAGFADLSASQLAALRARFTGGRGAGGGFTGRGGGQLSTALLAYLEKGAGPDRYLVAVSGDQVAEQPIIRTNARILPMGGFSGTDPAPTAGQLQTLVRSGELRYVIAGGFSGRGGTGVTAVRTTWIDAHCTAVPASAYHATVSAGLYDCAPARTP